MKSIHVADGIYEFSEALIEDSGQFCSPLARLRVKIITVESGKKSSERKALRKLSAFIFIRHCCFIKTLCMQHNHYAFFASPSVI
jgi:hypothetical protein